MDELLKANVGYQGLETRRLDGRKVKIVIVRSMYVVSCSFKVYTKSSLVSSNKGIKFLYILPPYK